MDEKTVEQIVNAVLSQLKAGKVNVPKTAEPVTETVTAVEDNTNDGEKLIDITSKEVKSEPLVDNPYDADALRRMISKTSARIGVGRAGPRLKTQTMLALRADHAAARDSVFADVDESKMEELGLFCVTTCCRDRNEHLTRPDLGRKFSDETLNEIMSKCVKNPDVQIIVSDGLSSKAIEANVPNVLPTLTDELKSMKYTVGTPFFIKYGRVAAMDYVGQYLQAKVTCILIGERPGLGSAESMSAYIAWNSTVDMPEAYRTVVSNIYSGGITPVEAGAYIAEIVDRIYKNKASGVNLKK
jgi:ethanolamine ammonia-lyase small subunit